MGMKDEFGLTEASKPDHPEPPATPRLPEGVEHALTPHGTGSLTGGGEVKKNDVPPTAAPKTPKPTPSEGGF